MITGYNDLIFLTSVPHIFLALHLSLFGEAKFYTTHDNITNFLK